MRIAFLANRYLDPLNPRSWSGLPYYINRALEGAGVETVPLALDEAGQLRGWIRFLYWKLRHGKRYLRFCEDGLLRNYARQAERQLPILAVDAVFSPSTWMLARLRTDLPMVFWTDACFAGLLDFYTSFSRLAPPSIAAGHAAEQGALDGCSRAIYSTQWAIQTTQQCYQVDPAKLVLVPFGGNLEEPPALADVAADVRRRDLNQCQLLFVGVDWKRKGADIAVDALQTLLARGWKARLTVVGCRPPRSVHVPEGVEVIPFIGKETARGRARLNQLYRQSHFFIMPSRAEAFGVVLAEASAFGVPCLATDVGGLASVISDEVTGRLFKREARGEEYADYIAAVMSEPARYRALALAAAVAGASTLSWKHTGKQVAEILDEVVRRRTLPAPQPAGADPASPIWKR